MAEAKRDKRAELFLVLGLVTFNVYAWLLNAGGPDSALLGLTGTVFLYTAMYFSTDHSTPQKSLHGYILAAAAISSAVPAVAGNPLWLLINVVVAALSLALVK